MTIPAISWCSHLLVSAILLTSARAHAESVDPEVMTAAQSLYDQAIEAMDANRYAVACPKLERATELIPHAVGAREALAECYEGARRFASAWSQYTRVQSLARDAGQPERAAEAGAKAARLEPKLATLTVEVPDSVRSLSGLTITRNRIDLARASWGTAVPVDAGEYVIEVKAPERQPWRRLVTVTANGVHEQVKVPPLSTFEVTDAGPARPWQRPLGFVALGVGIAGLGTSGVLGGLAMGKNNASNSSNHCDAQNSCDDMGLALRQEARTLAHGSTGALVAGGVLAAAGILLVLTAPSVAEKNALGRRTGQIRFKIELSPAGLGMRGSW